MTTRLRVDFRARLDRLAREIRSADLDALVVSHSPNIRYLTGFHGSAGLLLVSGARADLVVDFRYSIAAREAVAEHGLAGAVDVVLAGNTYDETLLAVLRRRVLQRIGIEAAYMNVTRFNRLSQGLAASAPTPLNALHPTPVLVPTEGLVEDGRIIKDAAEIGTIREAAKRLAAVASTIPSLVRIGRSEVELAGELDTRMRDAGFERPAFETIVASGPNSARPHARPTRRCLAPGDPVLLDFGGVYDGYCVDLTRTVQLEPDTAEFRRLFDAVERALRAAISSVRPGVKSTDVDAAAREVLGGLGLGEAFGHGTGHGLGLEIHEEPRLRRPAAGQAGVTLERGMVFTVEPGVYLEGFGGVRIEDDVLVTSSGCEVLTRP